MGTIVANYRKAKSAQSEFLVINLQATKLLIMTSATN